MIKKQLLLLCIIISLSPRPTQATNPTDDLFIAIEQENVAGVKQALAQGACVDCYRDSDDQSAQTLAKAKLLKTLQPYQYLAAAFALNGLLISSYKYHKPSPLIFWFASILAPAISKSDNHVCKKLDSMNVPLLLMVGSSVNLFATAFLSKETLLNCIGTAGFLYLLKKLHDSDRAKDIFKLIHNNEPFDIKYFWDNGFQADIVGHESQLIRIPL